MDLNRLELAEHEIGKIKDLSRIARGAILKMTSLAKSGHPGGSMSTIDFLMPLLHLINIDPEKPHMEDRDMVVFSHGHVSPAAYAAFGLMGYFPLADAISQFRLAGSIYEGHVEPDVPGIEWASGNLGQGLSAACGFALAQKLKGIDNHIFVLMGDGEQQKGQLSEARRFASKFELDNITAFCDYNKLQICGNIEGVMPQNIIENYLADEWDVIEIDGHDIEDIQDAIFTAVENDNPTLILANTIMGKGISFMENKEKYHGSPLTAEQLAAALTELELENDIEKYRILRSEFKLIEHKINKPLYKLQTGNPILYTDKTLTQISTSPFNSGVFGVDETFNQHRLNDINHTNLKVITTHVGLDVGEDGKTHQCIDYLGVMRNLYNFKIIIPADPNQTDHVVRYAASQPGNFLIPMGRSKLDIIKNEQDEIIFDSDYKFQYGNIDKLRDGKDGAIFAMGTLVGNALKIADALAEENISLQVWNVSSPLLLDPEVLKKAAGTGIIFSYEDHNVRTGLGNCLADEMIKQEIYCKLVKFGVENYAVSGNSDDVFRYCELDRKTIKDKIIFHLD